MAADRVALLQLKQGLRSRLQSRPAWNIDQYTRDVEAALRSMWVALCEGEASPSP
jgi:predicted O-linked N-acetylglucosamine transferase (SPINDLY family)